MYMHVAFLKYMYTSSQVAIIHCRDSEQVGEFGKEINPLLVLNKKQQTAMHLAIEKRKPERVILLLKETEGKQTKC